jgi:hypothetical protein
MQLRRRIFHCVLVCLCFLPVATGQTITVRSFLEQKEQWPVWAKKKTPLVIDGRYEGRVAKQFRVTKLPMLLTPSQLTVVPQNIEDGQRMTVSGVLKRSGTRYEMEVSRIAVGRTDHERLESGIAKLGADSPELWYPLADEYAPIAEFYGDEFLQSQIAELRRNAFTLERKKASMDSLLLSALVDKGSALGIDSRVLDAIRFESIVVMTKADIADAAKILLAIRKHLAGWDSKNAPLESAVEKRFLEDPVAEYEGANDQQRRTLHRCFYRTHRLSELLKPVRADGGNGFQVAAAVATELPEETLEVARLRKLYIDYRLKKVADLGRSQLGEVAGLLEEFGRDDEKLPTIQKWLDAQEKRLNNDQLDGIQRSAEEYLWAFERWKHPPHRDAAVDLLKRAWIIANEVAPKDAVLIAQRLHQFGWTRLRKRWMTSEQVSSLPKDDVELAMREGRVVAGMKAPHIVARLGQAGRKIRVISAELVEEIWLYGDVGSEAIMVHMQRRRLQRPDEAVATLISQGAK